MKPAQKRLCWAPGNRIVCVRGFITHSILDGDILPEIQHVTGHIKTSPSLSEVFLGWAEGHGDLALKEAYEWAVNSYKTFL